MSILIINPAIWLASIMGLSLIALRWLLDMLVFTTSGDGTQSLNLAGSARILIKLSLVEGIGSFVYLRLARKLHILGAKELNAVHRLLTRLHLAWI